MNETVRLTITGLAGLGDGIAEHAARRVFAARTMPGDVVEATVPEKGTHVRVTRMIEPSADRVTAPCPYFSALESSCGGCALQHLPDATYTDFKQGLVREAVTRAGFSDSVIAPLKRIPAASRRRVTFRVERDGGSVRFGFRAERSHRMVSVDQCLVLTPRLQECVRALPGALAGMELPEVVHLTDTGVMIDLLIQSPRMPDAASIGRWAALSRELGIARVSWQGKGVPEPIARHGRVSVTLGGAEVDLPPGAFLQASMEGEAALVAEALKATEGARSVADLFAGLGTFGLPVAKTLPKGGRVEAYEGSGEAVAALDSAVRGGGLSGKLRAVKRDLFRQPLTVSELNAYDAVIVDPPRAGAKAQMEQLAHSGVERVCLISCNPATFGRDAALLKAGGYQLRRAVGVDQFVYSAHVEMVGVFTR